MSIATATKVKITQEYTIEKIPEDQTEIQAKLKHCFEKLVKQRVIRRADTLKKSFTDKIRVPRNKRVGMQPVQHVQVSNKRSRKVGGGVINTQPNSQFTAQMLLPIENLDHQMFATVGDDDHQEEVKGGGQDEVVWQIYHQHFMCELRNHEITNYVKKRVDDEKAAKLISRILREYPVSGCVLRPPFTLAHMHSMTAKTINMSREVLTKLVDLMFSLHILDSKSKQKFCGTTATNAAIMADSWAYTVDIESILAELKAEHAQSMVQSKFGGSAGRIFRLLVDRKRLEEKQVAEMAILPKKEVRTLLQSMMREGFTKLQEIPKDSARRRMLHLWTVDFTHVCKILMDRYYQTWVNLSIRCAREAKNVKPILSKINQGIAVNRDEKDQVERWKAVDRKLRHGMAEVAGLIHLFREYE